MLNQIAFERQPDDLILDPYRARNLAALRQPDFLWRPIPRSQISGFAASAHSEINALIDYFLSCQNQAPDKALPVANFPIPPDTPFAVECRTTFNYYHFVTESLCQLCLVEETGLTGPIYLHFPNNAAKTRPFARNFSLALFSAHVGMEQGHLGLSLALADCLDHSGTHFDQLAALHSAYLANPANWTVLVRIVWCARSLDQRETLRAALLALQDGFPERFAAFAKDRPWVQKHVADAA